jgi:type I restriction enzyme, S subunit
LGRKKPLFLERPCNSSESTSLFISAEIFGFPLFISAPYTIKRLYNDNLRKTKIPVPPLAVQEEIVKILDTFTTLEAELEAELEARKKQYAYYRDALLTPIEVNGKWLMNNEAVAWKTLGEVCRNVSSGGTPLSTRSDYYGGDIPWLRTQEVDWIDVYDTEIKITEEGLRNSSAKMIPANCVIVAMYGATAAKAAINKIPLCTNQACCNLEIDEEQANYRYVFYWLCNEYRNLRALGEGSQSNINGQKVKSFLIPIPSLTEQERIVAILDQFDALVSDISVGLPAELNARRQQYEYYRNKLLSFGMGDG